MRRRGIIVGLLFSFVAPLAAEAQPAGKVWRIGFLGNFSPTPGATFISTAFIDGLRQYGYVEGMRISAQGERADRSNVNARIGAT